MQIATRKVKYEDAGEHLIEFKLVQEVKQLAVLFLILKLDVVLPQTVKRKLGVIVDVDLHRLQ